MAGRPAHPGAPRAHSKANTLPRTPSACFQKRSAQHRFCGGGGGGLLRLRLPPIPLPECRAGEGARSVRNPHPPCPRSPRAKAALNTVSVPMRSSCGTGSRWCVRNAADSRPPFRRLWQPPSPAAGAARGAPRPKGRLEGAALHWHLHRLALAGRQAHPEAAARGLAGQQPDADHGPNPQHPGDVLREAVHEDVLHLRDHVLDDLQTGMKVGAG